MREIAAHSYMASRTNAPHTHSVSASRSSWFPPLIGILIAVYAMIISGIEGPSIPSFIETVTGSAYICYRLWPSSANARLSFLWTSVLVFLGCLVLRIIPYVYTNETFNLWIGGKSISGLILDSIALSLTVWISTNKLPPILHGPSHVKFWKVPLPYQIGLHVICLSLTAIFNPSILALPYFVVLSIALFQIGKGTALVSTIVGKFEFPAVALGYTILMVIGGYILSLPVISGYVESAVTWLPTTLGIPSSNDSYYNLSCVMPSLISIFPLFVMLPWWCHVGRGIHTAHTTMRRAAGRTTTAATVGPRTVPVSFFRPTEAIESMSPRDENNGTPQMRRTRTHMSMRGLSAVGEHEAAADPIDVTGRAESIYEDFAAEEEERRLKSQKRNENIFKYFRLTIRHITLPVGFIVTALLLPSTLAVLLLIFGNCINISKKFMKKFGIFVQSYTSGFAAAVFTVGAIWAVIPDSETSLLVSIGVMSNERNIWTRFLLLMSLILLEITCALVNRWNRSIDLPPSAMMRLPKWAQSVIGIFQSAEMTLGLILVVILSTCAIQSEASAIFILYAFLGISMLWWNSGNGRRKISRIVCFACICAMGLIILWTCWYPYAVADPTVKPIWMSNLGFPLPSKSYCFSECLPHILILSIACVYLRTCNVDLGDAVAMTKGWYQKYPKLLSLIAVMIPIIISLILFVTMPFDYFSGFVLFCFALQMGFLMEGGDLAYRLILRTNIVEVFMLIITILWVLVSMIPWVNSTVIEGLAIANDHIVPSEIAVMPNCGYLGKLSIVSTLLITICLVLRYRDYVDRSGDSAAEIRSSPNNGGWLRNRGVRKILIYLSDQLPRFLMFVIFLASVYQTNLLNEVTQFLVCFFLVLGRGWRLVGAVFSVISMLLLFLQYLASFTVVGLYIDWYVLDYIGLVWTNGSVARNIAIFFACIVQRNYQHFVVVTYGRSAVVDSFYERFDKYGSVVIAIAFIFSAIGKSDFYSIIYVFMGIIFIVRVMMTGKTLTPILLRLIAILVWGIISIQLALRLWFPTVCDWCRERIDLGPLCPDGLSTTEEASCIDSWQRWLNIPSSKDGNTELIDQPSLAILIAQSLGFDGPYTVPPIKGYLILWDFVVLWFICVCLQNRLLGDAVGRNAGSGTTSSIACSPRTRHVQVADGTMRVFTRAWIVVVEVVVILSCFTFRNTVDIFSLIFIGIAVWTIWSQEKLLNSRKKPMIASIIIALILILVTLAYQIPLLQCKFWYSKCMTQGPDILTSHYGLPDVMCVEIQSMEAGCENFGAFTWMQILIQIIGVMKLNVAVSATPFPMGLGPPVFLLAAALIQLAFYNYSTSYAEVDRIYFRREISVLREMRSRRLIAEWNSKLLIKNRQVKLSLEASKRKLVRVQESADELLNLFYSRLMDFSVRKPELAKSISSEWAAPSAMATDGNKRLKACTSTLDPDKPHLSSEYESLCSRGYSEEEVRVVLEMIDEEEPEEFGVKILELVSRFGLGDFQESDVYLYCRKLLGGSGGSSTPQQQEMELIIPIPWYIRWYRRIREFIANSVDDIPFLNDEFAAEPLSLHRKNDGVMTLFVKALYSNSMFFVCLSVLLCFVATNSVFDLVRVFLLLIFIPSWPYPSKGAWVLLLVYTFLGIVFRSLYQLPIFCGDGNPFWRFGKYDSSGLVPPCPMATSIGWDVVLGLQKNFGSSAVPNVVSDFLGGVIWPDLLVMAALFTYRSYLCKSGLWNHITVGEPGIDAGAVLIPVQRSSQEAVEDGEENLVADDVEELDIDETRASGIANLEESMISDEDNDLSPRDDESMIGSFIDLNYNPLDIQDRPRLSYYAVSRHMCNEDAYDRLIFREFQFKYRALSQLIQIYKDLRWDAQIHYMNNQCLRFTRAEREERNIAIKHALSNLPFWSSIYVKWNPFYAIKVGVDYYALMCILGMMMFFHVILFYSFMTGNSTDFLSSLKRSQFSGGLALLMFFHFLLIVVDRAYYVASFRRGGEGNRFSGMTSGGSRLSGPSKQQVLWFFVRVFILIVLFLALHAVIMGLLFTATGTNPSVSKAQAYDPLISNASLTIYYLEFMVYIIVSLFQIKEGFPRMMVESLRPEKTYHIVTDRYQEWRFLVYRAIPFLDELRILIDWTVTRTSLDLFQYFKLEDAHTYLWQTKREMEFRKEMWPAEPRTKIEKIVQGFGFLLLLMVIIIGPVLLFSTLIAPQTIAHLSEASLSVSLVINTCIGSATCDSNPRDSNIVFSNLNLYKAIPMDIQTLSSTDSNKYFPNGRTSADKESVVQQATFAESTDISVISASTDRIDELISLIPSAVMINLESLLSFQRASTDGSYTSLVSTIKFPACACKPGFGYLCENCGGSWDSQMSIDSMVASASALLSSQSNSGVIIPQIYTPVITLDALGGVQKSTTQNQSMALLHNVTTGSSLLAQWPDDCNSAAGIPTAVCPYVTATNLSAVGSPSMFTFILPPVYASNSTSGVLLSIGIVTVYITIVYAIGRFLRIVFDKESLRVIYLEIPRPDDFLDLAKGAQTARQYKDLPMEFRLYNCLIKLLRSPETLIALGGTEITGYGVGRTDDPPYPNMLTDQERRSMVRRRRANAY